MTDLLYLLGFRLLLSFFLVHFLNERLFFVLLFIVLIIYYFFFCCFLCVQPNGTAYKFRVGFHKIFHSFLLIIFRDVFLQVLHNTCPTSDACIWSHFDYKRATCLRCSHSSSSSCLRKGSWDSAFSRRERKFCMSYFRRK